MKYIEQRGGNLMGPAQKAVDSALRGDVKPLDLAQRLQNIIARPSTTYTQARRGVGRLLQSLEQPVRGDVQRVLQPALGEKRRTTGASPVRHNGHS